ncbi:hypothetical protein [Paraburkholderia sp. DHOC27]|uniref:hypothetical protein n=1 Tax=Paraburkholderia sp. DHOC27 TaxID=2303330 RepID=UPI000E3BB93C|nr:hypothetical protein [Paraburkholderia sp. DHOC27]RFU44386.1 hypothetical protein D0B32_27615 [Paraburkholderia sp. DHOC27]
MAVVSSLPARATAFFIGPVGQAHGLLDCPDRKGAIVKIAQLHSRLDSIQRRIALLDNDVRVQCGVIDLLARLGTDTQTLEAELATIVREMNYWQHQREVVATRIEYHPANAEAAGKGLPLAA